MTTIHRLPPAVANQIAAGEVVERPASIVKELIENALDAGARRVSTEIVAGGVALIRVRDDGCGLDREEMALAFERHATSKLRSADDLFAITTMGFRGEALPSIAAAAAEVEMTSRPLLALAGGRIALRDGVVARQTDATGAAGTSVEVRDVFANQPARRSFLRATSTETRAVLTVVSNAAIARPDVAFTLVVDGRAVFRSTGAGPRDAAVAAYGREAAASLLEATEESADGAIRVVGLIGPPGQHRASRSGIVLVVNERPIASRSLTYAIEEAYQGLLPRGRHPIAAVHVDLPPGSVDVNVHPTKAEVRFRDERSVFGVLQRAVRGALISAAPAAVALEADDGGAALEWAPPPPVQQRFVDSPPAADDAAATGSDTSAVGATSSFPALRAVGQIHDTYVIAEGPDGLYLIDQHAAHERVMFELFRAKRAERRPDVQLLLAPVVLDLSAKQALALERHGAALASLGFGIEPFGEGSVAVRAVPAALAERGDPARTVPALLEALDDGRPAEDDDRAAATLACHASVRAGMTLAPEEQRALIRQLEASRQPRTCPHGRPTMVHMSAEALERGFGRR